MKKLLCCMLILLCACQKQTTQVVMMELKENEINNSYDITGDNENDEVMFIINTDNENNCIGVDISINDEVITLTSSDPCYDIDVSFIQLSSNDQFFWLSSLGDNGDDAFQCLYQYQNHELIKVLQFDEIIHNYGFHTTTEILNVENNEITILQTCMSASLGRIAYENTYVYENHSFVRKVTMTTVDVTYQNLENDELATIRKDIKGYIDSSLSLSLKILKAGTKAKATSIDFDNNHFAIELTLEDNSTYWVKGSNEFDENNLILKECYYAG